MWSHTITPKKILNENSDNLKSPVAISMIDDYLKILKPAYLFNLNLQRNSSTIAEVVPSILKIINIWQKIANNSGVSKSIKSLCEILISQVEKRFNYEMTSDIYQVF